MVSDIQVTNQGGGQAPKENISGRSTSVFDHIFIDVEIQYDENMQASKFNKFAPRSGNHKVNVSCNEEC